MKRTLSSMSRRPTDRTEAAQAPPGRAAAFGDGAAAADGARASARDADVTDDGGSRDARRAARDAAIAYLARAEHTKAEVIRYLSLRRQASAAMARQVADALEREGLLDDRRLAERVVEVAVGERKAQSRAMLAQRLRRRGIAADIVREAVAAQPIDELSAARRLAQAKWRAQNERLERRASADRDPREAAREDVTRMLRTVGAYLGRKGFSGDVINQVLAELRGM